MLPGHCQGFPDFIKFPLKYIIMLLEKKTKKNKVKP